MLLLAAIVGTIFSVLVTIIMLIETWKERRDGFKRWAINLILLAALVCQAVVCLHSAAGVIHLS